MMETDNDVVENVAEAKPSPAVGKILREARLAQGLSIADVAASIKFAPRQVEALEAEDYAHLPELAFVRGFVRSYARLLHIDEIALLNELPLAHKKLTAFQKDLADVPLSAMQSTRRINVAWLSAALGLSVTLGLGVWLLKEKPVTKMILPSHVAAMLIEPATSAVVAASAVAVVSPAPIAPAKPVRVSVPKKVEPKKLEELPIAPPKEVRKVAPRLTSGSIHLVFEVESWTEISDAEDTSLLKQINQPDTERWLDGVRPFSLLIGNASGVHLYFEGKEINLSDFTKGQVARLTLE
ncbi:MAG: DUF4115 domain-containing protein [Gallionellaceae bacterium]